VELKTKKASTEAKMSLWKLKIQIVLWIIILLEINVFNASLWEFNIVQMSRPITSLCICLYAFYVILQQSGGLYNEAGLGG